jgi:hypothetical protein
MSGPPSILVKCQELFELAAAGDGFGRGRLMDNLLAISRLAALNRPSFPGPLSHSGCSGSSLPSVPQVGWE